MGAPPFPVKKRQKLLLFDFLWVKNGTKKRTALGQFSLPVMYGYEKIFRSVSRRLRRAHRQLRCPELSDRHGSYLPPQSFSLFSLLRYYLAGDVISGCGGSGSCGCGLFSLCFCMGEKCKTEHLIEIVEKSQLRCVVHVCL